MCLKLPSSDATAPMTQLSVGMSFVRRLALVCIEGLWHGHFQGFSPSVQAPRVEPDCGQWGVERRQPVRRKWGLAC